MSAAICRAVTITESAALAAGTRQGTEGSTRDGHRMADHAVRSNDMEQELTVPEAARRVGYNRRTLNKAIAAGRLRATLRGPLYFIQPGDLEVYAAEFGGRQPGRPRGVKEAGPRRRRVLA